MKTIKLTISGVILQINLKKPNELINTTPLKKIQT